MDLEAYLMQKNRKKAIDISPTHNAMELNSTLTTPTKSNYAREDYSPGSEYWTAAMSSQLNSSNPAGSLKSIGPKKEKVVDFKSLKASSTSSVANLLKRMKGTEIHSLKIHELEGNIASMEEGRQPLENAENLTASRIIAAIEKFEIKLEAQKNEILGILQSETLRNEKLADQVGIMIDKKFDLLQSLRSEVREEKTPFNLSNSSLERFQQEVSQQLMAILAGIQSSSNAIDRPTKAIISAMNDKLIYITKLQEHEFSNQIQKLSLLEKKIGKPHPSAGDQVEVLQDIRKIAIAIESHIGRMERQQQSENTKLEKLLKANLGSNSGHLQVRSSEEDFSGSYNSIHEQMAELKKIITKDQKLTEERMSQFMNMFSILQTAHLELLNRLDKLELINGKQ